jgi:hypothetical protein
MSLSRDSALRICQVVAADTLCSALLTKPVFGAFGGWAGPIRNLLNTTVRDKTDDEVQSLSCIGVSEATTAAVERESAGRAQGGTPALPDVQRAITIRRVVHHIGTGDWEHHACKVMMTDGSEYVFDWFVTLDASNPWIYRVSDWRLDMNEIECQYFYGFRAPH